MARSYQSAVLFRSSVFSKMNTYVPLGGAALIAALAAFAPRGLPDARAGNAIAALVAAALALAALLFHRLTVTFDGREIVLGYNVIKKRIPLGNVFSVEPYDIKWWRFGGTGIRLSGGGWAWVTGSGPGVKIETTRGLAYANCEQPERLAALVNDFKRASREQP
jgi:hypothetical protein